jgi:hypothetical protein
VLDLHVRATDEKDDNGGAVRVIDNEVLIK